MSTRSTAASATTEIAAANSASIMGTEGRFIASTIGYEPDDEYLTCPGICPADIGSHLLTRRGFPLQVANEGR
jgi:hypothetical protein